MLTFLLDEQLQAQLTTNANGLVTLKTATRPEAISQLVRLRLLIIKNRRRYEPESAIDWMSFMNNPRLLPVLGTKIRALIAETEGVQSVSLDKALFQLMPSPQFTGICFTMDCGAGEVSL